MIAFVIMAAVIYYLVVVPFGALLDRYKKEPEPDAPVRECPECLSSIPAAATRCAFCTAVSRRGLAARGRSGELVAVVGRRLALVPLGVPLGLLFGGLVVPPGVGVVGRLLGD